MSIFQNKLMTVVIVEDDPMVCRVTQGFLEKIEGCICINTYESIAEAKEGLLLKTPMLVLLDVFFSKSSGLDLLKWIRDNELDTDVILITADNSTKSLEKAMRYGAIDYLVKPFRFSRFEEALQKFIKVKSKIDKNIKSNQEGIDLLMKASDSSEKDDLVDTDLDIEEVLEKVKLESNKTYKLIKEYLEKNPEEAYTAGMIGEKLGISRITARRYLDKMEANGSVEFSSEYGTIGRPKNYYKFKEQK